jgi:Endosomal/lysosomal potassium channel TMEM175
MRWPIARNRVSTPTSGTASVPAAGAGVRLLPITRLEAFSDAVFAIAITLLVLELHVPAGNEALVKGLEHEWPRYLGYVVSFTFVGTIT